jgi:hypothetical protein
VKALQPLTKSGRRTGSCSGARGGQYKPGSDGFLNALLRLGNHGSLVSLRSRSALVLRTAETQDRQENDSQKNEAYSETDAFAEAFAMSIQRTIPTMMLTNGINIKMIHQAGRPTILHQM